MHVQFLHQGRHEVHGSVEVCPAHVVRRVDDDAQVDGACACCVGEVVMSVGEVVVFSKIGIYF